MTYGTPALSFFFFTSPFPSTGTWCKSKELFLLFFCFFSLMHFTLRPYLKAFPSSTFESVLPTKSGFVSTGGHALMRLKMGPENLEHCTTYGWILFLRHRPRQDRLLQILCLPLRFETLLRGWGGRRVTFTFPQAESIFCPNLFPLVCKNYSEEKKSFAFCLVWRSFKFFKIPSDSSWMSCACVSKCTAEDA